MINPTRRDFLHKVRDAFLLAAAAKFGVMAPSGWAAGRNKDAFVAVGAENVAKAFGGQALKESTDIEIHAPEIAEDGAMVPVNVTAKLAKVQWIALLVEKNPNTLAAQFEIPEGTDPYIATRIKMRQTSRVIALVKADEQYFFAAREVKVTTGGCG